MIEIIRGHGKKTVKKLQHASNHRPLNVSYSIKNYTKSFLSDLKT